MNEIKKQEDILDRKHEEIDRKQNDFRNEAKRL